MSEYVAIDRVIDTWVKTTGSTLFTEWAGAPARYFHVPGDPPFECFQVSVARPSDGRTAVTARAIDTNDDTEEQMDHTWEGPVAQLNEMLGAALAIIEHWKSRKRTRPDPPSPWERPTTANSCHPSLRGRVTADRRFAVGPSASPERPDSTPASPALHPDEPPARSSSPHARPAAARGRALRRDPTARGRSRNSC